MITYKIHLFRTGKTNAKQGRRFVGQMDIPLCEKGIEGLNEMAKDFEYPRVEMVFTSPLSRCVETAEILYPNTYTEQLDGLIDMSLGEFEGRSFDELRTNKDFSLWIKDSLAHSPPNGEDMEAFTQRIIVTFRGIFERMMNEKMASIAVITHGGVIMTLLAAIGLPKMPLHEWATDNGHGYTLLFTPQMWMRDGAVEVFSRQPLPREHDGFDDDGSYYDGDYED